MCCGNEFGPFCVCVACSTELLLGEHALCTPAGRGDEKSYPVDLFFGKFNRLKPRRYTRLCGHSPHHHQALQLRCCWRRVNSDHSRPCPLAASGPVDTSCGAIDWPLLAGSDIGLFSALSLAAQAHGALPANGYFSAPTRAAAADVSGEHKEEDGRGDGSDGAAAVAAAAAEEKKAKKSSSSGSGKKKSATAAGAAQQQKKKHKPSQAINNKRRKVVSVTEPSPPPPPPPPSPPPAESKTRQQRGAFFEASGAGGSASRHPPLRTGAAAASVAAEEAAERVAQLRQLVVDAFRPLAERAENLQCGGGWDDGAW